MQTLYKKKNKKAKKNSQITKRAYNYTLRRDKGRCVVCSSKKSLECHHIISRGNGGTGDPSNLVMLCKECHYVKIHSQGDYETKKSIFEYMINLGYDFEKELNYLNFKNKQLRTSRD